MPVAVGPEHIQQATEFCEMLSMAGLFAAGFNANGAMSSDERAAIVPPLSRIIARNPGLGESFLLKYFDYITVGLGLGRYGYRLIGAMNAPKSDAVTSEVPNFADTRPTPAPQNDVGSLSQTPVYAAKPAAQGPTPTPMPAPFQPTTGGNGGPPLTTQGGEYRISGHGEDGLSGGVESLDQLVSTLRQEQGV